MENKVVALGGGSVQVDPVQAYLADIRNKLDAKIPREVVRTREAGNGRTLDYLEGWYVIDRMNVVFGQGNWSYVTEEMKLVHEGTTTDKYGKTVYNVHYTARVAVRALNTIFIDYGYGDGSDKQSTGKAHELAVKEAVTDGIKRCCKNFGMSMGLALYDRTQENVDEGNQTEIQPATRAGDSKRTAANQPASSKNTAGPTSPQAPVDSGVKPDVSENQEPVAAATRTRQDVNALISSTSRVILAKKLVKDTAELVQAMHEAYGVEKKEELSDPQAAEFLVRLETMLNGGKNV